MARLIRNPAVERIALKLKSAWDWTVAKLVGLFIHLVKKLPPEKSTDMAERAGRLLAPILPRTRMARENMAAAFPEKSPEEIAALTKEMWGYVARTMAEYVFLDDLFDYDHDNPDKGRVEIAGLENFLKVREGGKPVIIFTAHTGNWEILPVAASTYDLSVTALFRPPNNPYLAKRVLKARQTAKGYLVPSRAGAAWALADVLERGDAVGLLADQAFTRGPHIEFLGRKATANPIAAKLARQYDCDIYPARCVRLPQGRFRIELQNPIDPPKREDGSLDIIGTTKMINNVIEGWVRENPAQWLWLHDRWKIKGEEAAKWRR
ncbi:lipid A biosynthesis lauroyl acyltransferase [Pseudahrensia aquimaris]|uniref:Lipid A biosynthesis lauroyl acyltransferase n=1 Tax=Pseudahrensia aquimaris TaxID=744461 RepID=A0ABW3FLN2_9HYPH